MSGKDELEGTVRTFLPGKNYGFIDGSDGKSYFVHIRDVANAEELTEGQAVTFEPTATPKGYRARKARAGPAPVAVWDEPDDFVMTRSDHVKGHRIVAVLGQNAWGESNDPNEAREILKRIARREGANAVVSLTLDKYTTADGCSNYQYTMHRFYGHPVIVKRTRYTSDPDVIAAQQLEEQRVQSLVNRRVSQAPATETRLVHPGRAALMLGLTLGWATQLLRMTAVLPRALALGVRQRRL